MVVKATNKTTTTAKEPAEKVTQTTLKVEAEKKPVKVEEKVAPKVEPKTETKTAEAKKPAAKKTPAKKTATRKTAASRKTTTKKTTTKKTAAKKETVSAKAEVFVQYKGIESSEKEIMKKVTAAWEAEGKKASAIKRVKLYVKPEDYKAYYVINEGLKNCSTGAVDL
ncbi:MAG: hypothetical protein J1F22_02825 [Lachnospiraceae bacterium]|nr:hypothetical protein [Lachnospiraceae bacterium]